MRERLTPASARAKAQKCRRAAELTSDSQIKAEFLKLAEDFETKACELEGLEDAVPKQTGC